MKILYVSSTTQPFSDLRCGGAQRTTLLLKACAQVAPTDVCVFTDDVDTSAIPENCRLVYSGYIYAGEDIYTPLPQRFLGLLGRTDLEKIYKVCPERAKITADLIARGGYDMIVVRYLPEAVKCGLAPFLDKLVIDIDDNPAKAHRMRLISSDSLSKRMFPTLKVLPDMAAMKLAEKRCLATFYSDPSEADTGRAAAYLPNISVRSMAPGAAATDEVSEDVIFFIGALQYYPNILGITHFVEKVWPEVRRSHPTARFRIAGGCDRPESIAKWNSVEGVEYLGFVKSAEDEYAGCKIAVAPIYYGTGTNIKVLEAMAMGRPCVTTPTGMRGYTGYFHDGDDVLVAADDQAYARLINRMLDDAQERRRIASNAREAVRKHFSQDAFMNVVKVLLSSL